MDRFIADGVSYSLAEKSLKLLPASVLHSRITLLEDAARACRAELQRRHGSLRDDSASQRLGPNQPITSACGRDPE